MSFYHYPKIVTDGLVLNMDLYNQKQFQNGSSIDIVDSFNTNISFPNTGSYYDELDKKSVYFDGITSHLDFDKPVTGLDNGFTVIVWFKFISGIRNGTLTPENGGIFEFLNGYPGWDSCFGIGSGGDRIYRNFWVGGVNYNGYIGFGGNNITNEWHNITITFDTNNILYYLDCSLFANDSCSGTLANGSTNFRVGRIGSIYRLNGNISNMQIYNRALSNSDILQNYNALKGRYGL